MLKTSKNNPKCDVHTLPKKVIAQRLYLWLQFLGGLVRLCLDAKETLNHVLRKNYNNSPTTYPQALKDFALEEIRIFSTLVCD
jgi:hypothetical protein